MRHYFQKMPVDHLAQLVLLYITPLACKWKIEKRYSHGKCDRMVSSGAPRFVHCMLDCACQGCPNKTMRLAPSFLFVAP